MAARNQLQILASLIKQRNAVYSQTANVLDRPAVAGHIAELVASKIFYIKLLINGDILGKRFFDFASLSSE